MPMSAKELANRETLSAAYWKAKAEAAQRDRDAFAEDCRQRDERIARLVSATQDSDTARLYHELLYQVSMKHPGETRHQTALRYLQQAEMQNNEPSKQGD